MDPSASNQWEDQEPTEHEKSNSLFSTSSPYTKSEAVIVASLIIRRFFTLHGVSLDVNAPRIVSVEDKIPFSITLRNEGAQEHASIRVDGPLLPWDGQYVSEHKTISL